MDQTVKVAWYECRLVRVAWYEVAWYEFMKCVTTPSLVVRRNTVACVSVDPESGAESVMVAQLGR